MTDFSFTITARDSDTLARSGIINTAHGCIRTPAFVPVGTQATVKSLTPADLSELNVQIFFVNTYHIYLRPGTDTIRKFSGLHKFMSWPKPVITDSGGFQIFSLNHKKYVNIALSESAVTDPVKFSQKKSRKDLAKQMVYADDYKPVGELVKIDTDGVTFTSHWDGSRHRFTPEKSLSIQGYLDSDIMIAFDECAPYPTTHDYAAEAMMRTHTWLERCFNYYKSREFTGSENQALYGVVQGSIYPDLRKESAEYISAYPVSGIAIGGVSVGESKTEMCLVLDSICPILPAKLPRHLLGVGEIDDVFELIDRGVDTFDCVQPTRLGRMGQFFIRNDLSLLTSGKHTADINKISFKNDLLPLDLDCGCYTCRNFTRSYLHHLFNVRELLGYKLMTVHNIYFMNNLVDGIRQAIMDGTYSQFKQDFWHEKSAP